MGRGDLLLGKGKMRVNQGLFHRVLTGEDLFGPLGDFLLGFLRSLAAAPVDQSGHL